MADDFESLDRLQRKPWKIWMSSAPEPTAVLHTAAELCEGTHLGHNILILNESVYSAGTFNGSYEQFYRYGIDLSPSLFDKRSKARVEIVDIAKILPHEKAANFEPIKFYVQDRDAALYPEDLKSFFAVNATWKSYFRSSSGLSSKDTATSYQISEMFSVLSKSIEDEVSSDICVSDVDEVFSSTMVFEDGKKAYTKLTIQSTARIVKFLLGAILFNSDASNKLTDLANIVADLTASQCDLVFNNIRNITLSSGKSILDYIYIWVKGPFCADYIDPNDFNQDLNQDAAVTHKNLLLANDYSGVRNDVNRYNASFNYASAELPTENIFLENLTRPYCPNISPMKDLLSSKILALSGISGKNLTEIGQQLIEDSYKDESYIGSVLVSPQSSVTINTERFTPFNFYDPESREDEDFYTNLGKVPTIIGRDGNLTTDGRIMSPSIDEIWYIIYKTILGVNKDPSTVLSTPISSFYNKQDSSLVEAIDQFKWQQDGQTVKGHPINFDFKFDDNKNVNGISVAEWVANPEEFYINVNKYTALTSDKINKHFDAQNPDEQNTRDIYSTGGDIALGDSVTHTKVGYTGTDLEYGPRTVPLSLRELEAAIMGVKYNVDNNFIFDSKTYAVTGKFGKLEKNDTNEIIAGGSLYQMHRDYNADVENPNTVFKMGADPDSDNGRDATFGDLNGIKETHASGIKVFLLDKNNKRTAVEKRSSMPLLVDNYGKSALLASEQGEYTGSDVYMAADGTWRYKAEHMRLPILRSIY